MFSTPAMSWISCWCAIRKIAHRCNFAAIYFGTPAMILWRSWIHTSDSDDQYTNWIHLGSASGSRHGGTFPQSRRRLFPRLLTSCQRYWRCHSKTFKDWWSWSSKLFLMSSFGTWVMTVPNDDPMHPWTRKAVWLCPGGITPLISTMPVLQVRGSVLLFRSSLFYPYRLSWLGNFSYLRLPCTLAPWDL